MTHSITGRDLNTIWIAVTAGQDNHVFWCRSVPYALKLIFGPQSAPIQNFLLRAESFMHLRRGIASPFLTFFLGNASYETRFLNIITWVHNIAEGVLLLDRLGFKAQRMTGSRLQTARMLQDLIDLTNVVITCRRFFDPEFRGDVREAKRLIRSNLFPDSPSRPSSGDHSDDESDSDGHGGVSVKKISTGYKKGSEISYEAGSGGSGAPQTPQKEGGSSIGPHEDDDMPVGVAPARTGASNRNRNAVNAEAMPWYGRFFTLHAFHNVRAVTSIVEVGARAFVALETLYRRVGRRDNFGPLDSPLMPVYIFARLVNLGANKLCDIRNIGHREPRLK